MAHHFNKREEQVMEILWTIGNGFMKDILSEMPDSENLAYNTILSVVRKLENRGLIGYEAFAGNYRYYPLLDKKTYLNEKFDHLLQVYFGNSPEKMLAFLQTEQKIPALNTALFASSVLTDTPFSVSAPLLDGKPKDKDKKKTKNK